jgi:hypothetical protein
VSKEEYELLFRRKVMLYELDSHLVKEVARVDSKVVSALVAGAAATFHAKSMLEVSDYIRLIAQLLRRETRRAEPTMCLLFDLGHNDTKRNASASCKSY